jgi:hypothetical protein
MAKILYTLKKNPKTDEYHLFEATPTTPGRCIASAKSMCKAMNKVDGSKFACEEEKEAFKKCAELGREVCGNCMKELYGTDN